MWWRLLARWAQPHGELNLMAQKRMFDKAIIETTKFLDVSLSAKAIYFLLGMEADDEGFVSPKRVLRLYGGETGDLQNLIDVGLIIPFKTGVIVITDWKKNNWLDDRRTKPTEYQEEKRLLQLTDTGRYELSGRLADAKQNTNNMANYRRLADAKPEERRGEENRVEESSVEESITPSQEAKNFFSKKSGYVELLELFSENRDRGLIESEFDKFILYWTEKNKSGTKERWEQQPTFEIKRRLFTWLSKMNQFTSKNKQEVIFS